jgi:hypothetical protein
MEEDRRFVLLSHVPVPQERFSFVQLSTPLDIFSAAEDNLYRPFP